MWEIDSRFAPGLPPGWTRVFNIVFRPLVIRCSGCCIRATASKKCEAVPRRVAFEARRPLYHSTLGLRVIKKKKKRPLEVDFCRPLWTAVPMKAYPSSSLAWSATPSSSLAWSALRRSPSIFFRSKVKKEAAASTLGWQPRPLSSEQIRQPRPDKTVKARMNKTVKARFGTHETVKARFGP